MSRTIGEALRLRPWRFLLSTWCWRGLLYTLTGMIWALPFSFGDRAAILLPLLPLLGIWISAIDRRRIGLLGIAAIPSGHTPVLADARRRWLHIRLGEAITWRESAYAVLAALIGLATAMLLYTAMTVILMLLAAPIAVAVYQPISILGWYTASTPWEAWPFLLLGLLAIVAVLYITALIAWGQSALARALLAPRELELRTQIESLHLSRRALLRAVEHERSRIERDLHDGVQQHMVTLAMQLGTLELELDDLRAGGADVCAAAGVLNAARSSSDAALAAMRRALLDLKPPTLAAHGLPSALQELADAAPLPITCTIRLDARFSPEIEHIAFLFASEVCTNALRHAGATRIGLTATTSQGRLEIAVEDDGGGGVVLRSGGGLKGLQERAAVIGGTVRVSSPTGGPTRIVLDVPAETLGARV